MIKKTQSIEGKHPIFFGLFTSWLVPPICKTKSPGECHSAEQNLVWGVSDHHKASPNPITSVCADGSQHLHEKIGSIVFIQDHSGKLFLRTFFCVVFWCFFQFLTRRGLTTHKQATTHLRNMISSPQFLELSKNPEQVHNGLRVMMFNSLVINALINSLIHSVSLSLQIFIVS